MLHALNCVVPMVTLPQWPPELYLWLLYSLVLLGERVVPTPPHNHPLQLTTLARAMAHKVHSPSHTRSQQRISGLMATLTLLGPGLLIVALIFWISDQAWILSALCLYLSAASRRQYRAYQAISAALRDNQLAAARTLLQAHVSRDTSQLSAIGVSKANLEWYSRFIIQAWVASIFWFALLGPLAALAYRGLYELAQAWPVMRKRWHDFGFAANWLLRRLAGPSILLSYLVFAAWQLSKGKVLPWRFVQQPFMHVQDGRLWRALASQMTICLGGPIMLEGDKRQRPRFNYGSEPGAYTLAAGQLQITRLQCLLWLMLSPLFLISLVIQ